MSAVCYLLAWTGTASALKPTLHIGQQQVTTAMDVVGGEDAEEPDTSM